MAKAISKETMMFGIFAVLAGLAAAYGVRSFMVPAEETPAVVEKVAEPQKVRLPVASQDLPVDRVVSSGDVIELPLTREQIKVKFKGLDFDQTLISVPRIVGRRLAKPISQGQPFLTTVFYLEGTGPSIAKKLQPGYRAVRLQVPETREAGVQPGMYVDVFFRASARPAKAGQPAIPEKTLTLLSHIEVLEAERPGKGKSDAGKPLLFTLAVPEEKADMFSVIEGRGELWLLPTPAKDKGTVGGSSSGSVDASTLAELLGLKPPRYSPPFETAIYRRGALSIHKFVDGKLVASRTVDRGLRDWEQPAPPVPANVPPAPSTGQPDESSPMEWTPRETPAPTREE